MNPFEFVIAIIVVTGVLSILRQRMKVRHVWEQPDSDDHGLENRQLRDEVRQLKERIQVLERIAVDKEDTLSRQIEELRKS